MSSFIGSNVKIGSNVFIGNNVFIDGDVTIGDNTKIYHNAVIGTPPQTLKPALECGKIVIGKNNTIREFCSVHMPSEKITKIGDSNYIMTGVSIGHDIVIGNNCIISNGSQIGGFCILNDNVNIGMNAMIHQRIIVCSYSMIGMGSQVRRNVPPFSLIKNDKSSVNINGLKKIPRNLCTKKLKKYFYDYKKNTLKKEDLCSDFLEYYKDLLK